jgi:hypothetical protein
MALLGRNSHPMIAAAIQRDVDGITKGAHRDNIPSMR